MPKISIIIPMYKTEPYLDKCMRSVLDGDFKEIEVILIDDGSPNGHECDKYAEQDSRVKVIHQENKGVAAARNKGLRHATAPRISFVDSDDWIHPQMYKVLYKLAEEHGADIVSCSIEEFSENQSDSTGNIIKKRKRPLEIFGNKEGLKRSLLSHPTAYSVVFAKLISKSLFNNISFPEGRVSGEDAAVANKLYHMSKKSVHTYVSFYFYLIRGLSVTHQAFTPFVMHKLDTANETVEYIKTYVPDLFHYARCFEIITALRIAAYFNKIEQKKHFIEYTTIKRILFNLDRSTMAALPRRHKILICLFKYFRPMFLFVWRKRLKYSLYNKETI